MKALNEIQIALKAPKGQFNSFGKYSYRSCEDILEAVKPLLGECSLIVSDSVEVHGDRVYIKATATLHTPDGNTASAVGMAREPLTRKGMDESQITGASSSYARKYALNGLFAIDDNKDADSTNNHGKSAAPKKVEAKPITEDQKNDVVELIGKADITPEQSDKAIKWASHGRASTLDSLNTDEAAKLIKFLEGKAA